MQTATRRVRMHGCPHCSGALFSEYEFYGKVNVCVNCGYRKEVKEMAKLNYLKKGAAKGIF